MTVPGLAFAQTQGSTDRLKGTLEGHTDPVYAVAWSRDGQTIATAGFDGTVRLWNAASRKQIKSLEGHTKLVLAVAFSPDGTQVVSGSLDKTARIWSYSVEWCESKAGRSWFQPRALAVKPDGKQVAAASGNAVKIWDLATGKVIKDLEGSGGEVVSLAWGKAPGQLACGDRSHTIRLWKEDFTPEGKIEAPAGSVLGLAYVPGKPLLVSAGSDGLARVWQLPAGQPVRIDAKAPVSALAASGDGSKVASASTDKVVRVWTMPDNKLVREITGNDQPIVGIALSGNGSQAAIALANKVIRICTVDGGKEVKRIGPLAAGVTALAFRHDGAEVAAAGDDKVIRIITVGDGKTTKELKGHTAGNLLAGIRRQGRQPSRLRLSRQDGESLERAGRQGRA